MDAFDNPNYSGDPERESSASGAPPAAGGSMVLLECDEHDGVIEIFNEDECECVHTAFSPAGGAG